MKLFKNTYIRFLEYNTFSVCAFKPNFAYSVCAFKPKFAHTIRAFKPKLAHVLIRFFIEIVISICFTFGEGDV